MSSKDNIFRAIKHIVRHLNIGLTEGEQKIPNLFGGKDSGCVVLINRLRN